MACEREARQRFPIPLPTPFNWAGNNNIGGLMADKILTVPFHLGDLIKDTYQMDAAEFGAYMRLLMAHYSFGEGGIPQDEIQLQKLCNCSTKVWGRVRDSILSKFTWKDGVGIHKRVVEEILNHQRRVANARANGQKSKGSGKRMGKREDTQPTPNTFNPVSTNVDTNTPTPKTTKAKRHAIPETSLGEFLPNLTIPSPWRDYPRTLGWSDERIDLEWRGFIRHWTGPDAKNSGLKRDWKRTWDNNCDAQTKRFGSSAPTGGRGTGQGGGGSRDVMASAKRTVMAHLTGNSPTGHGGAPAFTPYPSGLNAGIVGTVEAITVDVEANHSALQGAAGSLAGVDSDPHDRIQVADLWGGGKRDDEPESVV